MSVIDGNRDGAWAATMASPRFRCHIDLPIGTPNNELDYLPFTFRSDLKAEGPDRGHHPLPASGARIIRRSLAMFLGCGVRVVAPDRRSSISRRRVSGATKCFCQTKLFSLYVERRAKIALRRFGAPQLRPTRSNHPGAHIFPYQTNPFAFYVERRAKHAPGRIPPPPAPRAALAAPGAGP